MPIDASFPIEKELGKRVLHHAERSLETLAQDVVRDLGQVFD